jgi:LAGLIDADG DNA endonuclease family
MLTKFKLYNTNFYKNLGRSYRISPKAHLQLNTELEEIIVGSMLGDLSAERKNLNSNTRLHFKQSTKNETYVNHLYLLFKNFCGSEPKKMTKFDSRPNKMKEYSAIKFQTLSLPCFNFYRDLFYNSEGIKIIPSKLENLITARGLAYWIMDDGYKSGNSLYISTESFTLIEHQLLVNILKIKFELDCSYHKYTNGYRIYIFSTSREKLLNLIKPYLLIHFYYKFGLK